MMETITEKIADFLENERLGFVATVTPDNRPNVSPKGSIIVYNEKQLAFADIRSPDTMANIAKNQNVEISVISPISRRGYLFAGRGRIVGEGDELENLKKRFAAMGIKSAINAAVIVDIHRIEETKSPLYDLGYTEEQIKANWERRYFSN